MDPSNVIHVYSTIPIVNLGVSGLFSTFIVFLMEILLANTAEPDQTPHYVASDLDLHCLPMTLLQVPR